MKRPSEEERSIVRDLCRIESGLTDWELRFVESVAKRVQTDGLPLSLKQMEIAERILREKGNTQARWV